MSYLPTLGLKKPNYERFPCVAVRGHESQGWSGWGDICAQLKSALAASKNARAVLAVECYDGVLDNELVSALTQGLQPDHWFSTKQNVFLPPEKIEARLAANMGQKDSIFGFLAPVEMADYLDPDKRAHLQKTIPAADGLSVVYGPGALLCCAPDIVVYADMPRWEIQQRQRAHRVGNLGMDNARERPATLYKRAFFADWRACDALKEQTFERWDYILDTTIPEAPVLICADALREGLRQASEQPFRLMPFFDPGVWGGQWMREIAQLPKDAPNYAWCFDCVPEENSLLLDFGKVRVETPSQNLVMRHPDALLGKPVHARFGADFPIRFDLLDTMGGQNLSFQVHPQQAYAQKHFGLRYTQAESYYLLDCEPGARVYLGLADNVDPSRMMEDLETAQRDAARPFPADIHTASFPAARHDHFLIPPGCCHGSGAGCLVLEISHTPYIFTFKLWDWGRLDLDGRPRPINLAHGAANIRWEYTRSHVAAHFINRLEPVAQGQGWREERTGLTPSHFIETRRHWFSETVPHDTEGQSVHVLNLVEGAEAVVESPSNAFAPFVVHFAETFVIPAGVGPYTIRPHGDAVGKPCATIKAFVRKTPETP